MCELNFFFNLMSDEKVDPKDEKSGMTSTIRRERGSNTIKLAHLGEDLADVNTFWSAILP